MPTGNLATYRAKTRVQVILDQRKYNLIAQLTGLPLGKVVKYTDQIMNAALDETITYIDPLIYRYAPKATGQIRDKLSHSLHTSVIRNGRLMLRFGTSVHYIPYVANMTEKSLRHPKKNVKLKYPVYQRNSKYGKKGDRKRNPGQWRHVNYYGGPRWVQLEDRKAQENWFFILIEKMKTKLQKAISSEIATIVPSNIRRPFYDKLGRGVQKP